jgi:nucleoside-diphosphate-sugar epimerase
VILRAADIYGAGSGQGMIERMSALMRAGVYRVVGAGDNVLHHIHIDDLVEGVWRATTQPEAASEDFILAGPETTTLASLSRRVAREVGRELPRGHLPAGVARMLATVVDVAAHRGLLVPELPAITHEKLDAMTLSIHFDITKARRLLGFEPRVGYEEGVMRAVRGEWPALARLGAGS